MMDGWTENGGLLLAAAGMAVVGSVVGSGRWLRHSLALSGVLIVADALLALRPLPALLLGALLSLTNALAVLRVSGGSRLLDVDERQFYDRHLNGLSPREARMLFDQGSMVMAQMGEELTREGEIVGNLHFLASGCAAVLVDDVIVGRAGPGDMIGEACLIPAGAATATVRVAQSGTRLWFCPRERLGAFLSAQPHIATVLNMATMAALRDKLDRANRTGNNN